MDARVAAALVHLRQAGGVVVALGAEAGEAVDAVDARAPVVTGVDGTVVDVDVAHCSCEIGRYDFTKSRVIFNLKDAN